MLLETMFGDEVFNDASAKVAIFAVPTKIFDTFNVDMHIAAAVSKSHVPVSRHSIDGPFNAYSEQHAFRDDLGKWTRATFNVQPDMVFKIFAQRSPGFGRRNCNASQFIQMREGAAYREIRITLTQDIKARFQHAIIKGRFDLLTLEQAEHKGIKPIPKHFKHTYSEAEIKRIMAFKTLEAEIAPMRIVRERVVKRGDEKIIVRTVRRARTLELNDD